MHRRMATYSIRLFREFEAQCHNQPVTSLTSKKARELFCFLLLNRGRPHTRERLAAVLWPEAEAGQAKQYLRQTLWQLQSALDQAVESPGCLLTVDAEWISIDVSEKVWLDVAQFEAAYSEAQAVNGGLPDGEQARMLERAAALYRGDLLENWYQEWCLFERERLQNMYLAILDKLVAYYEDSQDYQAGIDCAMKLLHVDIAHERTYRRLMRLYYLAGDRTSALRQFQRCKRVLAQELGIAPSQRTLDLLEQIKQEQMLRSEQPPSGPKALEHDPVSAMLEDLTRLNEQMVQSQHQLAAEIAAIRSAVADLLE